MMLQPLIIPILITPIEKLNIAVKNDIIRDNIKPITR